MKNQFAKFFCFLAGAKMSVLVQCPYEVNKFIGIGATVFFTALMAAFSGGYAIYAALGVSSNDVLLAVLFGLFWGGMILNLDRFLVSTMVKTGNFFSDFKAIIPRLFLAILFGFVISKPLELLIFKKEINEELIILTQQIEQEQRGAVENLYAKSIEDLETENIRLQAELDKERSIYLSLDSVATAELAGVSESQRSGSGPIYREKKERANQAKNQFSIVEKRNQPIIDRNTAEVQKIKENKRDKILSLKPEESKYNGLLARLAALGRLTEKDTTIWWANFFIILLILVIEVLPVINKLLTPKGDYDRILVLESERAIRKAMKKVENSIKDIESMEDPYSIFTEKQQAIYSENTADLYPDEKHEKVNKKIIQTKQSDFEKEREEQEKKSRAASYWQKEFQRKIQKNKSKKKSE